MIRRAPVPAPASAPVPVALLAVVLCAAACTRQAPPPPDAESGASQLARANLPARDAAALTVSSPAFATGTDIPQENTQYGNNVFPGLQWTAGPPGTESYAVIVQDGDAVVRGAPVLHWTMANVPAVVTALEPRMTTPPPGAAYGPNYQGANHAYSGPHTPRGPKHRYHFQVFALDTTVGPAALTSYAALTGAMAGHVLASGEVVGLGQAPPSRFPF